MTAPGASHLEEWLPRVIAFLTGIGIPVREASLPAETFLPGVAIVAGELVYDPSCLRWPSDLLHEAGHIAVTPAQLRADLNDNLALDEEQTPYAGEVEAMAWSFAAATHLAMPPELLFHSEGYRGRAASLARSYALGVYPGVHGLIVAGLAASPQSGAKPYPHLLRWLRDGLPRS